MNILLAILGTLFGLFVVIPFILYKIFVSEINITITKTYENGEVQKKTIHKITKDGSNKLLD